jgi:HEAT repeat protein
MNVAGELGVITIDRAATIQSWNDWLASATGLAEDAVRGRALRSVVPPERADVVGGLVEEVLSTGTSRVLAAAFHRFLISCPPREPSPRFTEMQQFVTIAPLMSGADISGAIITIEDVTVQRDRQLDLAARLETETDRGVSRAIDAVGVGDWRVRGAAVRTIRQRASTAEIAHLLETLRREHQDFNVVSSALQVLSASRDVTSPLVELLSDPQADLRMHAALALGHVGDPAAVPALVAALDDEDPNVRFHAIEALGAIGAGDAVERLADIARSGDFFLSFPAIDALAKADDPRVGAALISLLDNELLRPAAVDTLAAIGDEDAVEPLVALLNGGADGALIAAVAAALDRIRAREEETFGAGAHIVDVARAALAPPGVATLEAAVEQKRQPLAPVVAVLGWSGSAGLPALLRAVGQPDLEQAVTDAFYAIGREAVEPLVDCLVSGERGARLAAASLLGCLGDRRAVAPLIGTLDGADEELTATAAAALARLGDEDALDPLMELFASEHATVRQAAIAAVNSIGAGGTSGRIRVLLENPDARVRGCAVRVAGYFGYDDCVPGVLRRISDPDEDVRRAVIDQLPLIDDPRVTALLVQALRSEVPRNRAAAAHALRFVEGTAAAIPLADALEDPDTWVRYFAAGALGQRRDVEAVHALRRVAEGDSAPHVRMAALQSLTAVDPYVAGEIAVPMVRGPDPEIAAAALTAVAAGSHPRADDLLEEAVKTGDAFMRRAAVQALPARSTARAAELLAWAARLPEPPSLSRLALEALGRVANGEDAAAREAAVTALLDLVSARDTREAALHVFATLSPLVVDDAAARLHSPRVATRLAAAEALARLRDARASEALAAALTDPEPTVRRAAVSSFGRLGSRAAASTIADLRVSDPDPGVRRLAAAMCRRHRWDRGAA